jgi:hypothetical protein
MLDAYSTPNAVSDPPVKFAWWVNSDGGTIPVPGLEPPHASGRSGQVLPAAGPQPWFERQFSVAIRAPQAATVRGVKKNRPPVTPAALPR